MDHSLTADNTTSRAEFVAQRRTGLGGSDAAGLLGLSRYSSAYAIWAEKMGITTDIADNERMRWGRSIEALLLAWAEEELARFLGVSLSFVASPPQMR
ncbi:MAG: YqaJ viral recombinase family protein, partial [Acidimicrobiales bacterium]